MNVMTEITQIKKRLDALENPPVTRMADAVVVTPPIVDPVILKPKRAKKGETE
jgi:hypothetical protein